MPSSRPILSLIADTNNLPLTAFLSGGDLGWADAQMLLRYAQAPPTPEELTRPSSWLVRCHQHLRDEYLMLREWFLDGTGPFSPALQAHSLARIRELPLRDGLTHDFDSSGVLQPAIQQFKSQLIFCERSVQNIPPTNQTTGNIQFSGISRLARAAFSCRAEYHSWRPIVRRGKNGAIVIQLSGEELAARWVSFRTNAFLIQVGYDPYTAWTSSLCGRLFGPVDEELGTVQPLESGGT